MSLFARTEQKAFSLIEAAIVLGIVGLVVSGIWVAAAELNFRMKQKSFNDGLLYIYTQTQALFPRDFPCGLTYFTTRADAMGIRPKDWPFTAVGSFGVPGYGDDLNLAIDCDANGKQLLVLQFWNIPYKNCNTMNTYLSARLPSGTIHTQPTCWSWTTAFTWKIYLFK